MKYAAILKKILVPAILFMLMFPGVTFAQSADEKLPIIPSAHALAKSTPQKKPTVQSAPTKQPVNCDFEMPQKPVYSAKFVAVQKKGAVGKKEAFETKVYFENTGNVPWFSKDSGCNSLLTRLGTDKDRDRMSPFFTNSLFWNSHWTDANRIEMESDRVDPNNLAMFTFWSQAPDEDGIFREFYTPVIEGVTWMDGGTFSADITVGEPNLDPEKNDLLAYIDKSMNLATIDLNGDKRIVIDLSEQRMMINIGDYTIRKFPVSTGKRRTPTPVGVTKILNKQEVRVSGGRPHYIMPKWMMFKKGGYGIHALPSLANDNGVYWREALNHIGTPRSHGCIRLLPKDAEFAYSFGEVGTTVEVRR